MADLKSKMLILGVAAFLLAVLARGSLAANRPPNLSPIGSKEVYVGKTLSFRLSAVDPDHDKIFFSGRNLPVNSYLNPDTGLFSWTPEINQVGVHTLTFSASDDGSPALSTSETVKVRVIYRLIRYQKAWGFGVETMETIVETDSLPDLYPRITKIEIDGKERSLSQPLFSTSENPVIRVEAFSPYHIDRETISVFLDGERVEISSFFNVQTFGEQKNILSLAFEFSPPRLSPGKHTLAFSLGNDLGLSTQNITLATGILRLLDTPLAYPSPFNPSLGGELTLQYSLSQDADIDIYIISSSAQIVKRLSFSTGQEGGKSGLNKITWDGRSDLGGIAANGIYVATIIDKAVQKNLGKVKLVIY
jgi:hypothetical protein